MDMIYWILIIAAAILNICMIVWLYEIRQSSKAQVELLKFQNEEKKIMLLAQIELLAGIAYKLGMPVEDINEAVSEFEIEYEL